MVTGLSPFSAAFFSQSQWYRSWYQVWVGVRGHGSNPGLAIAAHPVATRLEAS